MAKPTDISSRAARAWQRLTEWYGVRMAESYGATMPKDWADVVDRSDNETVKRGLSIIRHRYLQHPPTLPQFEQALEPALPSHGVTQSPADQLCAHVVRSFGARLTDRQLRTPWTYLGGYNGPIAGVVIPADGDRPGYRVMVTDIAAASFTDAAQESAA